SGPAIASANVMWDSEASWLFFLHFCRRGLPPLVRVPQPKSKIPPPWLAWRKIAHDLPAVVVAVDADRVDDDAIVERNQAQQPVRKGIARHAANEIRSQFLERLGPAIIPQPKAFRGKGRHCRAHERKTVAMSHMNPGSMRRQSAR